MTPKKDDTLDFDLPPVPSKPKTKPPSTVAVLGTGTVAGVESHPEGSTYTVALDNGAGSAKVVDSAEVLHAGDRVTVFHTDPLTAVKLDKEP